MAAPGNVSVIFILSGIPELEDHQDFLAFPLCLLYVVSLLGNFTILVIIRTEESFHQPMYILLAMLAMTDIGVSLTTLPTVLGIFCFNYDQIHLDSCLTQMYFLHTFAAMESGVLVVMAVDRLIAIWDPLRYSSILTNPVIGKIGLGIVLRGLCVVFPIPFLTRRFPFNKSHLLSHSYCLHQDVIRVAGADTTVNSIYGLVAVLMTKGVDSMFIVISYILILKAVLDIRANSARLKAFSTCVCHICAVLLFYIPLIGLSLVHRFGKNTSHLLPILMADVYLLFPPVINPVIYSMKTKQIRQKIAKVFNSRKLRTIDNKIAVLKV
ncbi:PREDICTED: olfactory receptor 51G2-like [Nanorana parkeri]|uniref:olfactory receptor 51G2-like n=1 Tax=Nanorana parkeri TaxID=125878 RepID=UPI000854D113|nr:PREDICTED: olfactory receptor 51G2-like [Nanorana parkeri]